MIAPFLELNVTKAKEMFIDFNKHGGCRTATTIHGQPVEVVQEYKYLGTVMDDKLRFDSNTEVILKKCQQRQYFLRKLYSFGVSRKILNIFYTSFIESILTFSSICWFHSLSIKNKKHLQSIVHTCSKIIGHPLQSLTSLHDKATLRKASCILEDSRGVVRPGHSGLEPRMYWG